MERERKRGKEIVLVYYVYTGFLLSIVKIKKEIEREKEREKTTNNKNWNHRVN